MHNHDNGPDTSRFQKSGALELCVDNQHSGSTFKSEL